MSRRPVVTILMLIIPVIPTLPMRAQEQPYTQKQVSNMVRAGLGDDFGAKLIEQRGIDFAPADDFLQSLKAAGANEAFLEALRAAKQPGLLDFSDLKPPEPASAKKPLNQVQVFALLVGQVPSHRVTMLVQERGIDFEPTDDYLQEVRLAGGEDELISALQSAKVTKPVTVNPPAQAQQAEVQQHVAHGAELAKKGQHAQAEEEFRAAEDLQPENAEIHYLLGCALLNQQNLVGADVELREAVRLRPDYALAHLAIGVTANTRDDKTTAFREFQKAYILDPEQPNIRKEYAQALVDSWPSLIISGEGSLPTSWSDTWRFYVYHCSPDDAVGCLGDTPVDACLGELELGNGRIKHSCRHIKYSFDASLSDVSEAKINANRLMITLKTGKKTRTLEFVPADRLGHTACPISLEARPPIDALLDAILQAMGK